MREQEMRQRVERFLQTRLRSMLLPATLGLGLAVGACNSDALSTDDGGDPPANKDSGSVGMKYMAQMPDAGPELPQPTPDYMAQMPDANTKLDTGMVLRYMAQMPPDASEPVTVYMAPLPATRT
jgi:hypothetical protein